MAGDLEARKLGDTEQESTIVTFGAIALNWLEQEGANQMVEHALDHGVNHFDVAPQYGDAELKLGPKLRRYREEIFLGWPRTTSSMTTKQSSNAPTKGASRR